LSQVLAAQVLPLRVGRSSANGSLAASDRAQLPWHGSLEYATDVSRVQRCEEQPSAPAMGRRSVRRSETKEDNQLLQDRHQSGLDDAKSRINDGLLLISTIICIAIGSNKSSERHNAAIRWILSRLSIFNLNSFCENLNTSERCSMSKLRAGGASWS
jgi:hypothetical protein